MREIVALTWVELPRLTEDALIKSPLIRYVSFLTNLSI